MKDVAVDSAELSFCRVGQGEQPLKDERTPDDPTVPRALSALGSKVEVQSLKCHGGPLPTGGVSQAPQQHLDEALLDYSTKSCHLNMNVLLAHSLPLLRPRKIAFPPVC